MNYSGIICSVYLNSYLQMPLPTPMLGLVRARGLSSWTMLLALVKKTVLYHVPMTQIQQTAFIQMMLEFPVLQIVCP